MLKLVIYSLKEAVMASIIDSFRETFGDNLSFVKIIVFALPVYFSYQLYITSKKDYTGFFIVAYITIFLLFGLLVKVTNGVLNDRDSVFPSLNPFPILLTAFKGLLAILPYALISCLLASYLTSIINIIYWLDITLKVLIWLIAFAVILTAFLMYSTRERILDVYKIKAFSDKAGDAILMLFFYVIQLVIINIPTTAFIGYIVFVLFGIDGSLSWIFIFYLSMVLVFNVAVSGHYFAQLHYELFDRSE